MSNSEVGLGAVSVKPFARFLACRSGMTRDGGGAWKHNAFGFCAVLVAARGDANVGRDPKTIATYLRHQASAACRDAEFEIAARLGTAATCINEDARNDHEPNWRRAAEVMHVPAPRCAFLASSAAAGEGRGAGAIPLRRT